MDIETARVAKLDMLGRQQLSREEIMLRARAQFNQAFQAKRVDDAAKALGQEKKGWLDLGGVIKNAGSAVVAAGIAYATLATAKAAITGISDAWKAQRKDVEDSVLRVIDYQGKLRELADLKNRLGRTTPEFGAQLALRSQTTQTAEDARQFNEGILNAGASAITSDLISKDEFNKLTVAGGKSQVVKSIAPEAAGNFFGILPSVFGGKDQKAEDVAARGLGISDILQKGGSSASSGINQFLGIATLANSGSFKSPEELAATQSYFSLGRKDRAAEMVQQFERGTTGALDKTRQPGIEGGEAIGEYLTSIGAKAGMSSIEIARKISDDAKVAQAKDPNFNMGSYLSHHGYGNQEDRFAVQTMIQGIQSGQYDKSFGSMAEPGNRPKFADAMKPIEESLRVDPTAMDRRTELAKDTADVSRGVGAPALFAKAKEQAFYRLKAANKTSGKYDESNQDNLYQGMLIDEVQREAFERAKKAGVDTKEYGDVVPEGDWFKTFSDKTTGSGVNTGVLGGLPMYRMMYSEKTRAEKYAELETKIGAAGGGGIDNSAALVEAMKNLAKATNEQNAILAGQKNGGAPAVAVGVAQVPPLLGAAPAKAPDRP